ncbi:hypothetical protein BGW38_008312, partial [Lunasporangiospora selenospora]
LLPSETQAIITQALNNKSTLTKMNFFKSSKNKSASAASTPAQTPRSSFNIQRPNSSKQKNTMTLDEALEVAMSRSIGGISGPSLL